MYEAKGKEEILWKRHPEMGAVTGVPAVGLQNIISGIRRYFKQQQLCEEGACRHEQDRQQVMRLGLTDAAATCTVINDQQLKHTVRHFCWRERPVFRMQTQPRVFHRQLPAIRNYIMH